MSIGELVVFDPTKEFVDFVTSQHKKHTITLHPGTDIVSVLEVPGHCIDSFQGVMGIAATLDGELVGIKRHLK